MAPNRHLTGVNFIVCLGFASKLWSRGGVGSALDEIRLVICCNECDDFNNKSICTNIHTHKHTHPHKAGVEVMQKAEQV